MNVFSSGSLSFLSCIYIFFCCSCLQQVAGRETVWNNDYYLTSLLSFRLLPSPEATQKEGNNQFRECGSTVKKKCSTGMNVCGFHSTLVNRWFERWKVLSMGLQLCASAIPSWLLGIFCYFSMTCQLSKEAYISCFSSIELHIDVFLSQSCNNRECNWGGAVQEIFQCFHSSKSMQKYGNIRVHLWGGKASQDWKEPRRCARIEKSVLQTLKCLDNALSLVVGEVNPPSRPLVVLKLVSYNNFSESFTELRTWLKGLWLPETVTGKLGLERTSGGL